MRLLFSRMKKLFTTQNALAFFLFAVTLTVLLCFAFLPKHEISEKENRSLQMFPKISLGGVADGTFMREMNDFIEDQFPARDFFVSLNTTACLLEGNRDLGGDYSAAPAEGGVYVGKADHLYEVLPPDRNGVFAKNAAGLASFARESGLPLFVLPVPSGATEQRANLPDPCPGNEQGEEMDELRRLAGNGIEVVDLSDSLSLQKTGKDYYFKTDHHWNTFGAYVGYTELCKGMGIAPTPQSAFSFRTSERPFYGTLYSKAPLFWQQPDRFVLPYRADEANLTQETGGSIHKGLYWDRYLTEKDQYSTYLGGNPAVTVVRNPAAKKGKILLLKDSYANSMIPYLATDFSEIHLIDLRYYNQDLYDYIRRNGIRQAAAIYSLSQLSEVPVANRLLR